VHRGDRRSRWAAIGSAVITGLLLALWVVHLPRPGDTVAPRCEFGNRPVTCPYSPAQIRTAYGIQPLLDQGIDGRGRTVVLYEQAVPADGAAHASNIYQDLAAYRPVLAGAGGTSAGAPPCGSQEAPEDLAGIRQGRTFQVRIFGGGLDPVTGKAGDAG
jgi:hypothetical protein